MTNFSNKDIDRFWSQKELEKLSQKDLTKLAFLRNLKNVIFFGTPALVVYVLIGKIGIIGVILGWLSIGILVLLSIEPIIAIFRTLVTLLLSVVVKRSETIWLLFQWLTVLSVFVIYISLATLIYFKLHSKVLFG